MTYIQLIQLRLDGPLDGVVDRAWEEHLRNSIHDAELIRVEGGRERRRVHLARLSIALIVYVLGTAAESGGLAVVDQLFQLVVLVVPGRESQLRVCRRRGSIGRVPSESDGVRPQRLFAAIAGSCGIGGRANGLDISFRL